MADRQQLEREVEEIRKSAPATKAGGGGREALQYSTTDQGIILRSLLLRDR
jgi:type II secretory pathway component PulM